MTIPKANKRLLITKFQTGQATRDTRLSVTLKIMNSHSARWEKHTQPAIKRIPMHTSNCKNFSSKRRIPIIRVSITLLFYFISFLWRTYTTTYQHRSQASAAVETASSVFLVITRREVSNRRFGTTYQSHLQGSSSPRRRWGGFNPTFRDYLSVPPLRVKLSKKIRPTGNPETSVSNPEHERIHTHLLSKLP
jgi:hypothetical protein